MPPILTKRKQAWVNRRKPDVILGTPITYPAAVEIKYYRKLESHIESMASDVTRQLTRFFKEPDNREFFVAEDASISSQARILTNSLTRKYNAIFAGLAPTAAESFANNVNKSSSSTVHTSLKQLSGGLSLPVSEMSDTMKNILSAVTVENVTLIKSISAQYLSAVQQATMRSITTGNGLADLVPFLEKYKGITKRRAMLIATDQTKKAMTSMSGERCIKAGIKKFRWKRTNGSKEHRPLHVEYDGQIFEYANPPVIDTKTGERGLPGQLIHCSCVAIPIIDFDD
jgi:uncharacterized protein with gpF-like domain